MQGAAETKKTNLLPKLAAAITLSALTLAGTPCLALSQLGTETESQRHDDLQHDGEVLEALEGSTLPQPTPAIDRSAQAPAASTPDKPAVAPSAPATETNGSVEVIRDFSQLPAPVQKMREQIVEAAASGDVERLRSLFGSGDTMTNVMGNEFEDPIEAIKNFSGDPEGQEILAITLDILATGAVHLDKGTPDEAYVWPYFAGKSLNGLTPPERVDILRIVTAGDLAGMEENGNYNFFRLGIAPDGKWKFLLGGD